MVRGFAWEWGRPRRHTHLFSLKRLRNPVKRFAGGKVCPVRARSVHDDSAGRTADGEESDWEAES
jgi:hypothetical protein